MRYLTLTVLSFLTLSSAYGQSGESCRFAPDPTLQKPEVYAGYDCVNLLDSTSVTVQPTGSGSFSVCKTIKIQTPRGAVANRIIKYDYDPLTAFAQFKRATVYRANGDVINLDVTRACDYAAPARAIYWGARQIMLEVGQLNPGAMRSTRKVSPTHYWQMAVMTNPVSSLLCAGNFMISFLSGLQNRLCVKCTKYPFRWKKRCSSSSIRGTVLPLCVTKTDVKHIHSRQTISCRPNGNPIW